MVKKTIFILSFFTLFLIVLLLMIVKYQIKYNNSENKNNLITITYSSSEIDRLINQFGVVQYQKDFSIFSLKLKKECIRKTKNGGYLILKEDDGKEVYVFFNTKHVINGIIRLSEFQTKDHYTFLKEKETTLDQILALEEKIIYYTANRVGIVIFLKNEIISVVSEEIPTDAFGKTTEWISNLRIDSIDYMPYEHTYWEILSIDRE